MLTGLRLQNFKSWDDTGQIRLAPLTVLFGRNSSGKSSLLQSLLLMKQTVDSLDQLQVLNLGSPDALVDLGTYGNLVFGHDTNRDVSLSFDWEADGPQLPDILGRETRFSATVGVAGESQHLSEIVAKEMTYFFGENLDRRIGMRLDNSGSYSFTGDNALADRILLARERKITPIKCYGFPRGVEADGIPLSGFSYLFEEAMSGISYVGPLRSRPNRTYQWRGSAPASVGPSGENTVAALLSPGSSVISRAFRASIGFWLKQMGVISEFEIVEIAEGTDRYELRVTAPGGSTPVAIPDVGFGVSQVLPVLVQAFYAKVGTSVLLEQPEIHLHPAAQSVLGDALLRAVQDNRVQLLVETHSEHLLHRIQRRIAEERVAAEDVALYFVETAEGRSVIHELKVDEYGNIENWPQDFFGDEMGDLSAMTEAARPTHLPNGWG
jgi:predicted ATPase